MQGAGGGPDERRGLPWGWRRGPGWVLPSQKSLPHSGSISSSFSSHPRAQAWHEVTAFSNSLPPLFANLSASNPTADPSFPRGSQCLLIHIPQRQGLRGLVTEPVGQLPFGQLLHPTGA